MSEMYYIYKMDSVRREEAKVFTETESKKLKGQVELCGATFHLRAGVYGLLFCKPADRNHWTTYAKKNSAKIIEWQDGELRAPNGKVILTATPPDTVGNAPAALTVVDQPLATKEASQIDVLTTLIAPCVTIWQEWLDYRNDPSGLTVSFADWVVQNYGSDALLYPFRDFHDKLNGEYVSESHRKGNAPASDAQEENDGR